MRTFVATIIMIATFALAGWSVLGFREALGEYGARDCQALTA